MKPDGAYTDHPGDGFKPCLPPDPEATLPPKVSESVSNMDTFRIRRIGEDRLGQERLGKVNNIFSGGDGGAHGDAEKIVLDYLENRGTYLPNYYCSSPEVLDAAELFTVALFKRWTTRSPTKEDVAHVFFATRRHEQNPQTGDYETSFPQENKELLMYAFEQAANAGKAGNWNYIDGILRNLHQRGIQTLEQADDYDFERNTRTGR
jgi:DnaD/phage-associated family protein